MEKGALQISFGWLFAIIVGAFIIFLAIFGVTKFVNTEQATVDAKTSSEIGILLNPLETSFESAKSTSFSLPAESRINNGCDDVSGNFGEQLISVSQKNFNKWTETNIDVSFPNKYIFSKEIVEGKNFYLFSKPFDFPFKVSDLVYMTSSKDTYCFDASGDIEDEIKTINQTNLLVDDCTDEMINICFSGNCDIRVHPEYVEKGGETLYFSGDALMYAAIFADPEVYECQLSRLMQRIEELSLIYSDKTTLVNGKGCELDMNSDLTNLNGLATDFKDSEDLSGLTNTIEELEDRNYAGGVCGLW